MSKSPFCLFLKNRTVKVIIYHILTSETILSIIWRNLTFIKKNYFKYYLANSHLKWIIKHLCVCSLQSSTPTAELWKGALEHCAILIESLKVPWWFHIWYNFLECWVCLFKDTHIHSLYLYLIICSTDYIVVSVLTKTKRWRPRESNKSYCK
jgi:hypothetical protein